MSTDRKRRAHHRHVTRPALANGYPARMPVGLRRTVFATFAVLWASGCAWLVLHFGFPNQTEFGPGPNPWEPLILKIHGWAAIGSVFLLGWMMSSHISERWPSPRRRVSGVSLVSLAALLVLSGYALYYTTDRFHDAAALTHEVLGGAAVLFALPHWLRSGRSRRVLSRTDS